METAVPTAFSGSLSSPASSSPGQDSTSIHCVLYVHILPDAGHIKKSTGEKVLDLQRGSHVLQIQAQCKSHRGNELEHGWSVILCDHCSDKPPWHAIQWRKDLGAVSGCDPSCGGGGGIKAALEAAGHVEFTTRRQRVVNATAQLTLSFTRCGISAQGMVLPRMDKTLQFLQFNQPYQESL